MKTGTILALVIAAVVGAAGVYMADINRSESPALREVTVESGNSTGSAAGAGDIEVTEEIVSVPGIEIAPAENGDMASN